MNILYYDCFAGLSGDMNLAAMIDLGVEPAFLHAELDKLGLGDEFELLVSTDARGGIRGVRVDVRLAGEARAYGHDHHHGHPAHDHPDHEHAHGHGHDHHDHQENHHGHDAPDHHAHEHADERAHEHGHEHRHREEHAEPSKARAPHRNFADIRDIIMNSALTDEVKATSLRIFRKVAEAEAKAHGKPVDEVHFHEVGATDSIVDIVGAAICFHRLGVDAVWASPIELGGGFVRCAHGLMPVPAPATVEILAGVPTTRGGVAHEATTPTGAAILAALVDTFTSTPAMTVTRTGYGVGHRVTEPPNLARVHLATVEAREGADAKPHGQPETTRARLLQCNIDDMTGEQLGDVMELLMEHGAMDVHFTAIMMKKNRPGTQISLLCGESDEARFTNLLFRNTTTLGVKSLALEKTVLERRFKQVQTPHGPVKLKEAVLRGEVLHAKPEYEECKAIARRAGIPLAEVYAIVAREG